jgi:hypothetical protein
MATDSFNSGGRGTPGGGGKAARNDITGQLIKSRANTQAYEDNYDRIFGTAGSSDEPTKEPTK